ncbi:unnamed protein product [Owenia fusiformis]|nr:unnamed protein product [Owenia fusiformis]
MIKAMDETVDPCDDFHEYACGRYLKENVIPEDKTSIGRFVTLDDEVRLKLRASLEEDVGPNDIKATIKAKDMYAACVNETLIENRRMTPMRDYINSLGGWPILGNVSWSTWKENEFDWQSLAAQTRRLSIFALMSPIVDIDSKNSSVFILKLEHAYQLGMPGSNSREYLLNGRNDTFVKAYEEWMVSFVMLMKETDDKTIEAKVRKDVGDVIDFDMEIANITISKEERRDRERFYNKWTIEFLQKNITEVDWLRYFNKVFEGVNVTIKKDLEINVAVPQYIRNLIALVNRTPKHVVANYLLWIAMTDAGGLHLSVGIDFKEIKYRYNEVLFGSTLDKPRWELCTVFTADYLIKLPSSRLYLANNFNRESKKVALDMVHELKLSFAEMVKELDWMDDATKKVALDKLEAMRMIIGFEDFILEDAERLNKEYEELKINRGQMFESVVEGMYYLANNGLKKIGQLVTDENSGLSQALPPHQVNAAYDPSLNQMIFASGILQGLFFNKDFPKALNFGAIGVVIGHEMTHGFDDEGRLYDKDGNLFQWWSENVIKDFKKRAQCFINQYGNFTIPEINMNLNGINTQGENIADNGGLKQALSAYRNWAKRQDGRENGLPGLALSNEQLFFLSFAQIWCGKERPEQLIKRVRTLRHPNGRFRAFGTLQNCPDFSEAFNCKKGDKMNPENKCKLW